MWRSVSDYLDAWLQGANRKPLVLRGARQVGKTWLVRDLAQRSGRHLVELNFERDPSLARHFAGPGAAAVVDSLSLALGTEIAADTSLVFLDEIQAAPQVLAKLRWFAEEAAQLPVVAAGSLLEFALAGVRFSMPVGRIGYVHVEPMNFEEYLCANGQDRLRRHLRDCRPGMDQLPEVHQQGMRWWNRFLLVGGMPEVVGADKDGRTAEQCRDIQRNLVATYRDDFAKYAGRMDVSLLDSVLRSVVIQLGRKFVYSHVGQGVRHHQAKQSLELLAKARLVHLVVCTAANGVPLGGQRKEGFRKAIMIDVGLAHALLGTPAASSHPHPVDLAPQVRAQLVEQFCGQSLRQLDESPAAEPELYYWQREGGRPGEIDYLVQMGSRIVPVELKAGATGAMKSLHQFMFDKGLDLAVRFDTNIPSLQEVDVRTTQGDRSLYRLVSLPHYLIWNLKAILNDIV